MEPQSETVVEWRIENLSRWREEVHGECIRSPEFCVSTVMELYPKGQDERLLLRFTDIAIPFSGDLSICSSNGSPLWQQRVNAEEDERVLELPPGPEFEDVFSTIIREDFITLRLRIEDKFIEMRMRTTINVFRVDLEMGPERIVEVFESGEDENVLIIQNDSIDGLWLISYGYDNKLQFFISPAYKSEFPFAVEMSLKRGDSFVKREHVFLRDTGEEWTFPESLEKEELVGKGTSLPLRLNITTSRLGWSRNSPYGVSLH